MNKKPLSDLNKFFYILVGCVTGFLINGILRWITGRGMNGLVTTAIINIFTWLIVYIILTMLTSKKNK
jgi:TM2 domain-containing membrane protein YozV